MKEQILEQVQELTENWIELFKDEDQEEIAKAIKQKEPEKLDDNEFISDLKQIADSQKMEQYIETFLSEIQELKGEDYDHINFPLEKYKDLNKGRIAQEMADFSIYQLNMRPVDVDRKGESTEIYQYDMRKGVWNYFPKNHIGRLAKDMAEKEYSKHLNREFKDNLTNHPENINRRMMGLENNEILIKDKKVLKLDTAPEYETRDVKQEDRALYMIDAEYNPDAECERWKELVDRTLDGNEKQIKTLQEYMGWLLKFPNRDYKKALLILGVTNTGKSQIAEVVKEMFDRDAISNLSMNQLGMERRFHVDKLGDAVVNIDRDMSAALLEGTDTIKQAISQEEIAVEPKGQDAFTIEPKAKFFICSNVAPNPDNVNDGAFYGRFLTLKAPNSVPEEDMVPNIGKKIYNEESSGILNWMLEGLQRLEEQGGFTLNPSPYETKVMWNEYGNSVQQFVYDCIEQGGEEDIIPTQDLYEEYEIYMTDNLGTRKTFRQFSQDIKQQPFIKKDRRSHKGQMTMCFVGLKVQTDSGNLETN